MMSEEKIRTGISISKDLLKECDRYLADSNYTNRSELIETALKLFLAIRIISEKSDVLAEIRKSTINNVRRTKDRINLDDLICKTGK